jgi:hypothetical protein
MYVSPENLVLPAVAAFFVVFVGCLTDLTAMRKVFNVIDKYNELLMLQIQKKYGV